MKPFTGRRFDKAETAAREKARKDAAAQHGQGGNSVPALRNRLDTVERALGIVKAAAVGLALLAVASGCRSAGCIRIEAREGARVTIHGTGETRAAQGKTTDVAREAAVSGLPGTAGASLVPAGADALRGLLGTLDTAGGAGTITGLPEVTP